MAAAEWTDDANGLVKLVTGYLKPLGDLESVFLPINSELLAALQNAQTFARVANASKFLKTWHALFQKINDDGCGNLFTLNVMQALDTTAKACVLGGNLLRLISVLLLT